MTRTVPIRPLRPRLRTAGAIACCVLLILAAGGHAVAAAITPNGSRLELPAVVQPLAFGTGTVLLKGIAGQRTLRVEIAKTGPQHQRGLMYRTAMPETSGMIFIYPRPVRGSFWMLNTLIPLSIAYVDEHGIIFQITDMATCGVLSAEECTRLTYPSQQPFRYALEVNRGYFSRQGIRVGDRIELVED
jgi:hypothetical protein